MTRYPPSARRALLVTCLVCLGLAGVEAVLLAGDAELLGPRPWRLLAYGYGGFWRGLLGDWQANYPGQPVLMFLTYAALHADLGHLVGNVATLLYLGPAVAHRVGTRRMLAILALSVPGGAAGFALLSASAQPMVGASGAIFGLAGALLRQERVERIAARAATAPVWWAALGLMALNLGLWVLMDGQLAWEAHAGGMATGWAAAAALDRRARPRARRAAALGLGLVAGLAVLVPRLALAQDQQAGGLSADIPHAGHGAPAGRGALERHDALEGPVFEVAPDGALPLTASARTGPPGRVAPGALAAQPPLGPPSEGSPAGPAARRDPAARAHALLARLLDEGRGAGNLGDVYENRDAGHSQPDLARFGQIARVLPVDASGSPVRRMARPRGLAGPLPWRAPTVGNASLAITEGPLARSLPRAGLTIRPDGLRDAAAGFAANRLYVYPEHRDHDLRGRGARGDLFPANVPYWIVTQGSSGSDRAAVEALVAILAAFRPETKARLVEEGLAAPAMLAAFRAGLGPRGAAWSAPVRHAAVVDPRALDPERMVAAAAALSPAAISAPPRLAVLFERGPARPLLDSPHALARVWPLGAPEDAVHEMTVSAAATRLPGGRAARVDWTVLAASGAAVEIEPLSEDGLRARVRIRPAEGSAGRVDVAAFVSAADGAPLADAVPAVISLARAVPGAVDPALWPEGAARR